MNSKVWYITGASKGLGLALVKKLLNKGYRVAATSRNIEDLQKAVGADDSRFQAFAVSLTDESSVEKSIADTVKKFGTIDVVVNNAGYGLAGALEELTDKEARANFDINVFGSLNIIRKVLPYMRKQHSGHIFNIASIGGFTGSFPGFGIYCATKFAIQGLTESLAEEIKDFGLFATVVMPGYFRTNFLSDSSIRVPANEISAYKTVREIQDAHTGQYNGNQNGDPDKAADVFIAIAEKQDPPVHLFLGQDAYDLAEAKMKTVRESMLSVEQLATATAFQD
jgi:NAD(P)-dependent dehydrogenase (short-subunit alcohol dehydrogenase family)